MILTRRRGYGYHGYGYGFVHGYRITHLYPYPWYPYPCTRRVWCTRVKHYKAMELGECVIHEWLVVEMGAEIVLEHLNDNI